MAPFTRASLTVAACITLLAASAVVPQRRTARPPAPRIAPTIPTADRNAPGKVFLEHADSLVMDEKVSTDFMTLYGNVQFRKGGMSMYCDSARFYERTNSLDAFGNVRMEQGDTLFVYGDELNYDGMNERAVLYGAPPRKARLINRDVKLETDIFHYDLAANIGYYNTGGKLTDRLNTLTSLEGEYHPSTKDACFYYDVRLTSPRPGGDTLRMVTDSLLYNTGTSVARLVSPTVITNRDGEIRSSSGDYNTSTGVADLYSRSTVVTNKGNTLTGDTLFFDRRSGIGEAFGSMVLTDTVNKATLYGDYGIYFEQRDSALVTGNALAKEYGSGRDTIYLHGDTINAWRDHADSTRVTNAFHRVRFYRRDVQGICDSLSLTERDSLMRLFRHPIVWNGNRQVYGGSMTLHLNDSTVDWARLPDWGLVAEHIAADCYQQMAGNDMTAWFADTLITRLYIEGNVQVIMFPQEPDSTYNKYAYAESSYLDAYFTGNDIERVKLWPQTTGSVTPLYLARKGSYVLPQFKWYADILRPRTPDEVLDYPPETDLLFAQPNPGGGRRSRRTPAPASPAPAPEPATTPDTPPQASDADD